MNAVQKRAAEAGAAYANIMQKPLAPSLTIVETKQGAGMEKRRRNVHTPEGTHMTGATLPTPGETNVQIARRLGLKKGKVVRLPDDATGQPVRKRIKAVDSNGMVTLQGDRTKYEARQFKPR